MAATQAELATQMIAQLRLIDPSASAEIGTPERKIIDTVAQQNADSQIDLVALQQALNLDAKYGANLDRFLALFQFNRIGATYASGFVTFSRPTASNVDILIPAGTQVATATQGLSTGVLYTTTFAVSLTAGSTSVIAPVRASVAGVNGNADIDAITQIVGTTVPGITQVTNSTPIGNGNDAESDDELKTRFRNTVFRNLAGTTDQYLALAISTAYSTKANVVGPVSRYREYIQIPPVDDASAYDVNSDMVNEPGGGNAGEYTSAMSSIPYAKALWTSIPYFVSNGKTGADVIFYRPDVDMRLNTTNVAKNRGDTKRLSDTGLALPVTDPSATNQPNVTFLNVYTGTNTSVNAMRPNDVVLMEFSYQSDASRNDLTNNVSNAVDVYVDSENIIFASTVTTRPGTGAIFVDDSTSKFHYENYRRVGQPTKRPLLGNLLMPLFWQPVSDVPDNIIVAGNTYTKGTHYWGVTDVSILGGTIAARSGIEWSMNVHGRLVTDPQGGPFTGLLITDHATNTSVEIDNYSYDKNIVDLQSAFEGAKQTTTDILAHKARIRYYKLDISVIYTQGASISATNLDIHDALDALFKSKYFGSVIQLSDLLQIIHNVPGVDNVRWTADVIGSTNPARLYSTDAIGTPSLGVSLDRIRVGNGIVSEIQALYLTGQPTGGSFVLTNPNTSGTQTIAYNVTAAALQIALRTLMADASLTVIEDTRSTTGVLYPIRSFRITYSALTAGTLPVLSTNNLTGGPAVITKDFFLRDNELASLATSAYTPINGVADTLPGLIIRPRAQNTFGRG